MRHPMRGAAWLAANREKQPGLNRSAGSEALVE